MDLHLHSTASDGVLPPGVVVEEAARAGLAAIALTDHDTTGGLGEAAAEGATLGLRVVSGCEISAQLEWGEGHVLAYCVRVDDPALQAALAAARAMRRTRAIAIVEALGKFNVHLSLETIEAETRGGPIGRPHLARALQQAGVVKSFDEAFDRFLGRGRPAFVPKRLPRFAEVAALVHGAGGVVSMAHLKERGSRELLQRLQDQGLDAVEVRHPSHGPETRRRLELVAGELGLLPTGGSDWHGTREASPSHAALGAEQVPGAWLAALETRAAERQSDERTPSNR